MRQSTLVTTPASCLEFEAGDFRLKVPESAMSEGFKTTMGVNDRIICRGCSNYVW